MAEYRLTPRAQRDLREIWRYVAADNEHAADDLLKRLFDQFHLAALQPGLGVARPELSKTARLLIEGRFIIIYEPAFYGVLIVAVVHGTRDPAQWLD